MFLDNFFVDGLGGKVLFHAIEAHGHGLKYLNIAAIGEGICFFEIG